MNMTNQEFENSMADEDLFQQALVAFQSFFKMPPNNAVSEFLKALHVADLDNYTWNCSGKELWFLSLI